MSCKRTYAIVIKDDGCARKTIESKRLVEVVAWCEEGCVVGLVGYVYEGWTEGGFLLVLISRVVDSHVSDLIRTVLYRSYARVSCASVVVK